MPAPDSISFKPSTLIIGLALAATCVVRFVISRQTSKDAMAVGATFLPALLLAMVVGGIAAAVAGKAPGRRTTAFNIAASTVLLAILATLWFFLIRAFFS